MSIINMARLRLLDLLSSSISNTSIALGRAEWNSRQYFHTGLIRQIYPMNKPVRLLDTEHILQQKHTVMYKNKSKGCIRYPRKSFVVNTPFTRTYIDQTTTSRVMVPLTTKEEQLSWADRIKPHYPHCITMYNNLLQHGHGLASHDTFYVLNHPTSNAVICEKEISPSPTVQHLGLFCPEEEVDQVIEALEATPIINWRDSNKSILIRRLPPYIVRPLQELIKNKDAHMDLEQYMVFTYDAKPDTEPLRVGHGLRVCRLGKAGVRLLLEKTTHERDVPFELMYNLAQRLPYVGVYHDTSVTQETMVDWINLPLAGDKEIPVAWVCSTLQGEVGKAMVEKEYRRQGIGHLLGTIVARQQATFFGFIPHATVHSDNCAANAMFTKHIGWNVTHTILSLYISITK